MEAFQVVPVFEKPHNHKHTQSKHAETHNPHLFLQIKSVKKNHFLMPIYQVELTVSSSFTAFYQESLFHILMAAAVCLCVSMFLHICKFFLLYLTSSKCMKEPKIIHSEI